MTVTFKVGTNVEQAETQVQNRIAARSAAPAGRGAPDRRHGDQELAEPHDGGPPASRRTIRYDDVYLRNYAVLNVKDQLARINGMGEVQLFGSGDYAMRVWLDPQKVAAAA